MNTSGLCPQPIEAQPSSEPSIFAKVSKTPVNSSSSQTMLCALKLKQLMDTCVE